MLAGDRQGDEIFWLTLKYVTRNMEKVLILSEKTHKNVTSSMDCMSITHVKDLTRGP